MITQVSFTAPFVLSGLWAVQALWNDRRTPIETVSHLFHLFMSVCMIEMVWARDHLVSDGFQLTIFTAGTGWFAVLLAVKLRTHTRKVLSEPLVLSAGVIMMGAMAWMALLALANGSHSEPTQAPTHHHGTDSPDLLGMISMLSLLGVGLALLIPLKAEGKQRLRQISLARISAALMSVSMGFMSWTMVS